MRKPSRALQAQIECVLGASGSGKTSYVMGELRRLKPRRLLVWDTKGEFAAEGYAEPVATMGAVVDAVGAAGKAGAFTLAYQPRGDSSSMKRQFDLFCRIAYAAKRLTLVAEELSDVTMASHAVEGWRRVSSMGRTEGLSVYGLSQRPARIDKDFFGNASKVRSGRLNFDPDIKVVAGVLRVPPAQIADMLPLQWIERDMNTGAVRRGSLAG